MCNYRGWLSLQKNKKNKARSSLKVIQPNCVIYKYEMVVKAAATGDGVVVVGGGWVAAADERDTFPIWVVRSAQTVRCGEKAHPDRG